MKHQPIGVLLCLLVAGGLARGAEPPARAAKAAFVFRGVEYFHRWSQKEQHEFTPAGQEDLKKWSEMVTVNGYPSVQDGDGLAATANSVLANYQKAGAKVLTTNSIPRTAERPAEHLIAVVFGQPTFIEVAFARLKMVDGTGYSVVYSHRIRGEKIGDAASAWLKAHGAETEKAIMEWNSTPAPGSLRGKKL
ncbi:MAG: hypothetical protein ABIR71_00480 [Chthoniobacterales bacterium]